MTNQQAVLLFISFNGGAIGMGAILYIQGRPASIAFFSTVVTLVLMNLLVWLCVRWRRRQSDDSGER